MNIKIVQPEPKYAADIEFVQPKYYFGQLLEDLKGDAGFVVSMSFGEEWTYGLYYYDLGIAAFDIAESNLAVSPESLHRPHSGGDGMDRQVINRTRCSINYQ